MSIRSRIWAGRAVGGALPLTLGAATLTAVWADLPATVATHWGPGGAADGFTDRGPGLVALSLGLPAVVWGLLEGVVALAPRSAPGQRWLRALPAGTTWFTTALTVGLTAAQAGGPGGAAADLVWWAFPAALGAGLAGAVAAALVQPDAPQLPARQGAPSPDAPRLVGDGGEVWWTGRAPASRAIAVAVAAVLVPGVVLTVVGAWWALLVIAPVVALVAASATFRVTVGARRVVAAGGFAGWPRLRVPLETVAEARVTTTRAIEWGGWGIRLRPGASGVITRGGEALELHRTDGTRVVLTVDDAATAAAAVNSLLERDGAAAAG